jgi:Phage terminase, small subunit
MAAKKPAKRVKPGTSKQAAALRKELFADSYIANGCNATDAAIKAGYSPKTAQQQGARLLSDVMVLELITKKQAKLAAKFSLRTEDVLRELARIVYADPRKAFAPDGSLLPVHLWPDEVAAMISSIESDEIYAGTGEDKVFIGHTKKVKFWDKNSAIDKAMKHLGQYEQDNMQKGPFGDMSPEALDRFIARKAAETGSKLH